MEEISRNLLERVKDRMRSYIINQADNRQHRPPEKKSLQLRTCPSKIPNCTQKRRHKHWTPDISANPHSRFSLSASNRMNWLPTWIPSDVYLKHFVQEIFACFSIHWTNRRIITGTNPDCNALIHLCNGSYERVEIKLGGENWFQKVPGICAQFLPIWYW